MKRLVCKCGNDEFKKSSVVSCSEVPPIFSCTKCNMTFNTPRSYRLAGQDFLPINTKSTDYFMGHLKCCECGSTYYDEWNYNSIPSGWSIETVNKSDILGNSMVRRYAYCTKCK